MSDKRIPGYMGQILRVDLSEGKTSVEPLDDGSRRDYVGGVSLGAKYLLQEVRPGVDWSSPENRVILMTGPFAGTKIPGSGTFCALTKGPLTNLGTSTQANGLFGAFLRLSGFDGLIIQGAAPKLTYLYIHESGVELRDAAHLRGKGALETEEAVRKELNLGRKVSVYAIGPSGENLVRFAALVGDGGHVAGHNGFGAVMGSKNLKAMAVHYGPLRPSVHDAARTATLARELVDFAIAFNDGRLYKWGTAGTFAPQSKVGQIPVKNYTTNVLSGHEKLLPEYTRTHFDLKPKTCWACGLLHVKRVRVTEGPYAGLEGEEPEYECVNAWGPLTGNTDPGAVVMLSNVTDDLGLDVNESAWMISWVMECYEKGYLMKKDTDGLEMNWGNAEATRRMLEKIARREGLGDILAEGVKRASELIGGEAAHCAIFTHKGNTPRVHDHRARWSELMDTALSDTGTIEATFGPLRPEVVGQLPVENQFSPEEVPRISAKVSGWHQFEDCLGVCKFLIRDPSLTLQAVEATTGWQMSLEEALTVGRRAINQLRVFSVRHGLRRELERPSDRYGSAPADGPAKGKGILPVWDEIVRIYYENMGWDLKTGKPLPETLRSLGLGHLIDDLWSANSC
jgi:aldehyde:ferredoxin oxidoreductase